MHRNCFFPVVSIFFLLLASGASVYDQRESSGVHAQAGLDEATVLENFGKMVELIWTDEEEDAWRSIEADALEEKRTYVAAFWERRDPTQATEDNEYREVWMARVAYGHRFFGGEGRPGWETDRGKFVLVYGSEPLVAQKRGPISGPPLPGAGAEEEPGTGIIWSIDTTRNPFLDGKSEVSFAQDQGAYSRSTEGIELGEEAFLAGAVVSGYFETRRANPATAGPMVGGATGAAIIASPTPGEGVFPTPEVLAMQQLMQNGVARQELALRQNMAFIPAQEGNTFAVFNFDLDRSNLTFESEGSPGPANMLAFGSLLKKDSTGAERFLRQLEISFTVEPSGGNVDERSPHSFGMTLEPGDYRLAWGVMDKASERTATASYELTVPNFASAELAIPSVVVATGLVQMADPIDINTVYARTRIGSLELETNLDNQFGRNESLINLYFIRGLSVDPSTQQSRFEVVHRILLAGTEEIIARLPAQELAFGGVQQEIPLGQVQQIEPGTAYEIEIQVTDQITGNRLIHKVPFSVR